MRQCLHPDHAVLHERHTEYLPSGQTCCGGTCFAGICCTLDQPCSVPLECCPGPGSTCSPSGAYQVACQMARNCPAFFGGRNWQCVGGGNPACGGMQKCCRPG